MKNIAIITTSRADYSIYVPVAKALTAKGMKVSFCVTGSHLDKAHGHTAGLIAKDGFKISCRVPCGVPDDPRRVPLAMAEVTAGIGKGLARLKPEAAMVLGDRYEMAAACLSAVALSIPLVHLHGGELTVGSLDEYYRHAITKLSSVHLTSCDAYTRRVIQMGEQPDKVFTVGAPGLDNALQAESLNAAEMSAQFGVDLSRPFILVTLHPVTTRPQDTGIYVKALIKALSPVKQWPVVFTGPNADATAAVIAKEFKTFAGRTKDAVYVENFGTRGYATAMRHAAVMLGNSSSGVIEAASYGLPVVNIGPRQDGRLKPRNVLACGHDARAIGAAIEKALKPAFRSGLRNLQNPYGDGKSGARIAGILSKLNMKGLGEKVFYGR